MTVSAGSKLSISSPGSEEPLGRVALVSIALLAAIPRCLNLGSFSMWLDEILQSRMARGSLGELLGSLARDQVHPPLDGLLTWAVLHLGPSESARRLLPVVFGVLTVAILSRWVSEHFGRTAGWATGFLAVFSPIHIQYSQELRPYSLALFFVCSSLWLFDREAPTGNQRFLALWLVPATAALFSLYFSIILIVPITVMVLGRRHAVESLERPARSEIRRLLGQVAILLAVFSPWIVAVLSTPRRTVEAGAHSWTLYEAYRRWHLLTLGGLEGDVPSMMGIWPFIFFVVAVVGARQRIRTLALLAGALAATVGIELFLLASDHWSNARYNLMAWPFITALVGIGAARIGSILRRPRRASALCAVLVTICCLAQVGHIVQYYERGRPNWQWIADAIAPLITPHGRILATNGWSRICLEHYLEPHGVEVGKISEQESLRSSAGAKGDFVSEAGCTYVVDGGYPKGASTSLPASSSQIARDPGGLGAVVYRLDPFDPDRSCTWAVAPLLEHRPTWRPTSSPEADRLLLDFGEPTRPRLVEGWADLEISPSGRTFAWVTAEEAFIALGPMHRTPKKLRLHARALADDQQVRLAINGREIGLLSLGSHWSDLTVMVAADLWSARDNLLSINCTSLTSARSIEPHSKDPRQLGIAVDQLAIGAGLDE